MSDRFDEALHKVGDWAAAHGKAATAIVAVVLGVVVGMWLMR